MKKMRRKKNAFTLIELIAVLVIMAIIALIVTPLVMNIVKKAKDSANKRSVDAYGKAVELAVATYLLDNGEYPTDLNGLTVEYRGNEVSCNVKTLNEDGSIYISECSVKGIEVKDSSTDDGWYNYGKSSNKDVAYQSYNVGDIITYNGIDFYVIEASDEASDSVTMLKAEPLTVDEVNTYGVGHINRYTNASVGTAYDWNGYGGMAYYTSETCGYVNGFDVNTGCTTDYNSSEIKYVVDAWASDKINLINLTEDNLGYSARLITKEEYYSNCEITQGITPSGTYDIYTPKYDWLYNSGFYWTMTTVEDFEYIVEVVTNDGSFTSGYIYRYNNYGGNPIGTSFVRPVINLKKSAI